MNYFKNDLNFSHDQERFWQEIYEKSFPTLDKLIDCFDVDMQRKGIDRFVHLTDGRVVRVEEKTRRKAYNDILLEYVSNSQTGTPGWIEKDLQCDYLAYAFLSIQRVHWFPFAELQQAWWDNSNTWQQKYGTRTANNQGYNTLSVPIPISVLKRHVRMKVVQLN